MHDMDFVAIRIAQVRTEVIWPVIFAWSGRSFVKSAVKHRVSIGPCDSCG